MPRVDPPTSSAVPRLAVAVLLVALIGAVAYIVHLQGRIAPPAGQRSAAPAPTSAAAQPAAPAAGAPVVNEAAVAAVLTADQQRAMRETLAAAPGADRKAWFQIQASNQGTAVVVAALQRVFESAGWTTETVRAPYGLKSGIFILAGDEQPPSMVDSVNAAFQAAGIDAQYLTGYREFFVSRKQSNPNWVGPELASGQSFVIAVGSQPTPKPAQ